MIQTKTSLQLVFQQFKTFPCRQGPTDSNEAQTRPKHFGTASWTLTTCDLRYKKTSVFQVALPKNRDGEGDLVFFL